MRSFALILVLALTSVACRNKPLSAEELQEYVMDAENGLRRSIDSNGFSIDVTYRPVDLLIAQEVSTFDVDSAKISELRGRYNQYHYFVLSLSKNGNEALHQSNQMEYNDLLHTLAFRMNEFTMLTGGGDTLDVLDFQLDRTFGQASSTNVIIAFKRTEATTKQDIRFHLKEFGLGVGSHVFDFESPDIGNIPTVDFSQHM